MQRYSLYTIDYIVLVFLLFTMNIFNTFSSACIVDFDHVNVSWHDKPFWLDLLEYIVSVENL